MSEGMKEDPRPEGRSLEQKRAPGIRRTVAAGGRPAPGPIAWCRSCATCSPGQPQTWHRRRSRPYSPWNPGNRADAEWERAMESGRIDHGRPCIEGQGVGGSHLPARRGRPVRGTGGGHEQPAPAQPWQMLRTTRVERLVPRRQERAHGSSARATGRDISAKATPPTRTAVDPATASRRDTMLDCARAT